MVLEDRVYPITAMTQQHGGICMRVDNRIRIISRVHTLISNGNFNTVLIFFLALGGGCLDIGGKLCSRM